MSRRLIECKMGLYTCAVCEGTYSDNEVMSTKCSKCEKTICIYCTEFDTVANVDVCDICTDEGMFNHVGAQCAAPLLK